MIHHEKMASLDAAVSCLREARDLLKEVGAPRATAAVRKALSSAKGARRHAELEPFRRDRQRRTA